MKIAINEQFLTELIERNLYAQALDAGGVDNWIWHSTAIQNFIQYLVDEDIYLEDYLKSINKITEDNLLDDVDLMDIAKYQVSILAENQEEEASI